MSDADDNDKEQSVRARTSTRTHKFVEREEEENTRISYNARVYREPFRVHTAAHGRLSLSRLRNYTNSKAKMKEK